MTITLFETINGANMTTASEATVSEITADDFQYWGGFVFIPTAFTTGDQMEIKFYVWNPIQLQFESLYYIPLVGGTSYNETAIYIPPTQTKRYRLTFKRTAGTDRTFRWAIHKQVINV
jgi:hypothetical protein